MVRCGLPSIEVQSLIDHRVVATTIQQFKAYLETMPPCWANTFGDRAFRPQVDSASNTASPI